MVTHHPLPAGYVLGKRYRIEKRIGAGGIGVVYEARDLEQDQLLAVKVLHAKGAVDDMEGRRFLSEAILAQRLQHPNIVRVIDVVIDDGRPVAIVMELLRGRDLAQLLSPNRCFSAERTIQIIYSVCCALGHAHALGIIHRDVKLENIFLHRRQLDSGERVEEVKLIDLGLAKSQRTRPLALTRKNYVMGTPLYMAPEMTRGVSSMVDERADQWAVAVVTYRMLSGSFPFERRPEEDSDYPLLGRIQTQPPVALSAVTANLPEGVYQAITKALAKKKEERFANIEAFARALQGLPPSLQGLPELLAAPDECVPLPRDEMPTRAVRFPASYDKQPESFDSRAYLSLRIEHGTVRSRKSSVKHSAATVAGKIATPQTPPLPVPEDQEEILTESGATAAEEKTAASVDEEEDTEQAVAAVKPVSLPGDRMIARAKARRATSLTAAMCMGAVVAINVMAVAFPRWSQREGAGVAGAPDAAPALSDGGSSPRSALAPRAGPVLPTEPQMSFLPPARVPPQRAISASAVSYRAAVAGHLRRKKTVAP